MDVISRCGADSEEIQGGRTNRDDVQSEPRLSALFVRNPEQMFLQPNLSPTSMTFMEDQQSQDGSEAPWIQTRALPSGAVWITVNRAQKHNALARPVLAELAAAVRRAGARDEVRYVVITGAGDRYFAAGGDLRDLA